MSKQKKMDFFLKNPKVSVNTTAEEPTSTTRDVISLELQWKKMITLIALFAWKF